MLRKKDHSKMGKECNKNYKGLFHFSFGSYVNYKSEHFGVLRVINDVEIKPSCGFDMHPHKDEEMISYIINGEFAYHDNLGNNSIVNKHFVQYISAGSGMFHSVKNSGTDLLNKIMIIINPDQKNYQPSYKLAPINIEDRKNKWLKIVANSNDGLITIRQDANIYVIELEQGREDSFNVISNRQAYLVQITGSSLINNIILEGKDALEIMDENITIKALEDCHLLIIEMKKSFE